MYFGHISGFNCRHHNFGKNVGNHENLKIQENKGMLFMQYSKVATG